MKKIISIVLAMIFVLSSMAMLTVVTFAQDEDSMENNEELTNIARVENSVPYATSEKNTLWTPARALNDGAKSEDTWQGWECRYPDITYVNDTSAGFMGEYCGIKFLNREYYEIYQININLGLHAAMGGQNVHYTVQCLVEGVWETVLEFNDSDTQPLGYESYQEAMEKDTSFYHIPSQISFTLDQPVNTNNFRIAVSGFGKNYPGGDVLIFPYIYEIELIGKRGPTPEIELPEGAVISTNIGYQSYPKASTSTPSKYPFNAIDGNTKTYWAPRAKTAGEYLSIVLHEPKKINKAVINFGEYTDGAIIYDYKYNIEALVDGVWVVLAQGTSFDEENLKLDWTFEFEEVETTELRVVFTEDYTKAPTVYEFEAHLSTEKTYYLEERYSASQKASAGKGNIAIIGTPYANVDFIPYSDVNYIIDGKTNPDAYVWFTGVIDMPSYCGIKFNDKQLIDRVALYFHTPEQEGIDIMDIQIQALIDGEYVTLVSTKSYDANLKYAPAFQFDPVETDDIRILYTRGNGTFAHLKELEIYSPNGIVPMFSGMGSIYDPPQFIDKTTKGEAFTQELSVPSVNVDKIIENQTECLPYEAKENNIVNVIVAIISTVAVIFTGTIACIYFKRKNTK